MPTAFGLGMTAATCYINGMFMRVFVICLAALWAVPSAAQSHAGPLIPSGPQDDDTEEVEDVVEDSEFLPREEATEGEPASRAATIRGNQAAELSLSQEEMRSRHTYLAGLGLGLAKPWQLYSFEWGYFVRPNWSVSTFGGGGEFKESGTRDDRSYDITVRSRGVGVGTRYYFTHLEKLSLEALVGYAAWDGDVEPQGAASDGAIAEKLSASFKSHGLFAGMSVGLTWLWDSGTYIEWTPVGARTSKIMQRDLTRDSEFVDKAMARTIERGEFYGLTNIEVGYLF